MVKSTLGFSIFCLGPTGIVPWIPVFKCISKDCILVKHSHWNLDRLRAETRIVIFVENSVVENEIFTHAIGKNEHIIFEMINAGSNSIFYENAAYYCVQRFTDCQMREPIGPNRSIIFKIC